MIAKSHCPRCRCALRVELEEYDSCTIVEVTIEPASQRCDGVADAWGWFGPSRCVAGDGRGVPCNWLGESCNVASHYNPCYARGPIVTTRWHKRILHRRSCWAGYGEPDGTARCLQGDEA